MAEITKTADDSTQTLPTWVWILFGFLTVFTYFFGLTIPLVGPDEPRYAQIAREMMERGDWITPTLGGFNWFEKPALLYWLEIAAYNAFGINEFAARLGPALCGLGTVAALWILGREVLNGEFANWLALIAATTLGIIVFSHGASFDIVITFTITAALVCFFIWHSRSRNSDSSSMQRVIPLILFYAFIGSGLLAKGLIGAIFPVSIVAIFLVLSRTIPSKPFILSLFWGMLIALSIAAIWYVPMYMRHGYAFIDEFLIQHHLQRFTSNKYQHPQPFYFFLWVLPLMMLPWLPFFLASLWTAVRKYFQRQSASPRLPFSFSHLLLFSLCWLVVPLIFFSFSGSKLPGYVLPCVPAAATFAGVHARDLASKSRGWKYAILAIGTGTLLLTVLLSLTFVPRFADGDSVGPLIAAADGRGYGESKVLMLHTISHNAEFYAAGRLLREKDGTLKKLYGPGEILDQINVDGGKPALVLVPLEYLHQLTRDERVKTEVIRDNGELTIAAVSVK